MALAVALLFVVFAGLLTWLALDHINRDFRANLMEDLFVLASSLADGIDGKLRRAQDMLTVTARQVPRQAPLRPAVG